MTRQFKFNGYHDKPYYGDGAFTKGKVYLVVGDVDYAAGRDPRDADALFVDDNDKKNHEEIQYFTEVTDG